MDLSHRKNARFEFLGEYKNSIMIKLLENDNIVKAVANNQRNFLDYDVQDKYGLLYNNIYPYMHIPSTTEKEKTFITMSFDKFRPLRNKENQYTAGRIGFFVFTHINGLMATDYNILRPDYLISEIDQTFFGAKELSIGGLDLIDMGEYKIPNNNSFAGSFIVYGSTNFR